MSWQGFLDQFHEGDEVRFNSGFLAQTSNPDYPKARGKIAGIEVQGDMRYATVDWDRPDVPGSVNLANLAVVKERGRE